MPYSSISAVITDAEKSVALVKLKEVFDSFSFLVNLTPDERHSLYKMGDKSVGFVQKSLEYAQNNPDLVPVYLGVDIFQEHVALMNQILPIMQATSKLYEALNDTYLALGSETMQLATTFYNSVKTASKNNVAGVSVIYEDLAQRFPGRAGKPDEVEELPTV